MVEKGDGTGRAGAIEELLRIMERLRDPQKGCPWDLEQDFSSIAPYTLEEAYEVADAIQRNEPRELCEELGDLLFQVVFHARMAAEEGLFDFADVVAAINAKMIRRHPHVFAGEVVKDARAQSEAWESLKAGERHARGLVGGGALAGVPVALPALVRAQKIQRRAAREGFDWNRIDEVVAKLEEELEELKQALADAEPLERAREELGDLLFSCVNLARFLDADAETLLRDANHKFEHRFRVVEELAREQGRELRDCTPAELESWWQQAKRRGP
ncbi:MAG TPA: nucleoside triphosphate pyrophosphohydrolase [Gammaproteobacteria bacterium]|nr:nucleoside triphosphate pyrophosphohydrolase [Gammaproteobacteria bacterium]